ncbi:hypothetical protein D3C73_1481160 [compost metagenome]
MGCPEDDLLLQLLHRLDPVHPIGKQDLLQSGIADISARAFVDEALQVGMLAQCFSCLGHGRGLVLVLGVS